jgi:hypothetical protein
MGSMHPSDYALVALAFFYSLNLGPMMFETFTSDALGREALKARADRWIFLSYFRNVVGVMSYVFLLFALLTPSTGAWQGTPPQ